MTVSLIVDSGLNQFGASQTILRTLAEDFYGTATLTGVAVLDSQKTVLSGGSVADTDSLFSATQIELRAHGGRPRTCALP